MLNYALLSSFASIRLSKHSHLSTCSLRQLRNVTSPVSDGLQVSGPLSLDSHLLCSSQVAVLTVSLHVCQVSVEVDRCDLNVTA